MRAHHSPSDSTRFDPAALELWMLLICNTGDVQYFVAGVIVGTLEGSSLLLDESRSQLNKLITSKIKANAWEHVSFVEINNVCDGGPELWQALKSMP